MTITAVSSVVLSSAVLAGSYVLLGLSWVIVFRATRVLNVATGQFMALGAYFTFVFLVTLRLPFVIALPLGILSIALFAGLSFQLFVRPLHGQPHFVVAVLTIGWSIVIGGIISIVWGPLPQILPEPAANRIYLLPGGGHLTTYGIATMVVATVVAVALVVFFRVSKFGLQMRAAAESPLLASQSAVNITVVFFVAWALAGALTTLAGVAFAYTNVLSPSLSQIGLRGLTPALIGGFESIPGTILGAILLAFVETTGVRVLGGDAEDAIVAAVLLIVLMIRPTGLRGAEDVRRV